VMLARAVTARLAAMPAFNVFKNDVMIFSFLTLTIM
jgi:hypothetical protein